MAADLIGRYNDTQNADFRNKVLVALVEAAIGNVGEPLAPGGIGSDKRTDYARQVLASPMSHIDRVCLAVVADGTGPASSDADIRTRVGNLWNAFAGVRTGE